jgi:hypothetical protein
MFQPIQKPATPMGRSMFSPRIAIVDTPAAGQNFSGLRFTGVSVLYTFPQSTLWTGIGVDYEYDRWNASTQRFYTDYAIGGLVMAGGQFAPNTISGVTGIGLQVMLLNKYLVLGVVYNITGKQILPAVGGNANLIPTN